MGRCILALGLIFFIIAIILNIIVYKFFILRTNCKESFITDYYDKYFNDISVPTKFYEVSAEFAFPQHYAIEMHDRFFIDTLDNEKNKLANVDDKYIEDISDNNIKEELHKRVDKYLIDLLNTKLFEISSDEKFIFSNIYSKITNAYQAIWTKGNCMVVTSNHIIYRDTKVYGVSLTITTLHNIKDGSIYLTDYNMNGFIFEDKIKNNVYPSNLIEDSYQEFKKDKINIPDKKYEQAYICKYLADIKKFRGINVNMQGLDCDQ